MAANDLGPTLDTTPEVGSPPDTQAGGRGAEFAAPVLRLTSTRQALEAYYTWNEAENAAVIRGDMEAARRARDRVAEVRAYLRIVRG